MLLEKEGVLRTMRSEGDGTRGGVAGWVAYLKCAHNPRGIKRQENMSGINGSKGLHQKTTKHTARKGHKNEITHEGFHALVGLGCRFFTHRYFRFVCSCD